MVITFSLLVILGYIQTHPCYISMLTLSLNAFHLFKPSTLKIQIIKGDEPTWIYIIHICFTSFKNCPLLKGSIVLRNSMFCIKNCVETKAWIPVKIYGVFGSSELMLPCTQFTHKSITSNSVYLPIIGYDKLQSSGHLQVTWAIQMHEPRFMPTLSLLHFGYWDLSCKVFLLYAFAATPVKF